MVSQQFKLTVRKLFTKAYNYSYLVGASLIKNTIGLSTGCIESWMNAAIKCIEKIKGISYTDKKLSIEDIQNLVHSFECTDLHENILPSIPKNQLREFWDYVSIHSDNTDVEDYIDNDGNYISKWFCGCSIDGIAEELMRVKGISYEFKPLTLGELYNCAVTRDDEIVHRYSVFQEVSCRGEILGYVGYKPETWEDQQDMDYYFSDDRLHYDAFQFDSGWFYQDVEGNRIYAYTCYKAMCKLMNDKILDVSKLMGYDKLLDDNQDDELEEYNFTAFHCKK